MPSGHPRLAQNPCGILSDLCESRLDLGELFLREDACLGQASCVLAGRLAVVRQKLLVAARRNSHTAGSSEPATLPAQSLIVCRLQRRDSQARWPASSSRAVVPPGGQEDRVVPRQRASNVRVATLVDRLRERARVAGGRGHDDQARGRLDTDRVSPHRRGDGPHAVGVARPGRGIDARPWRAHLDQSELGDVARDCGLDDVEPGFPQRRRELGLRRQRRPARARESVPGAPVDSLRRARSAIRERLCRLGLGDDQGRGQAQHIRSGREDEQSCSRQLSTMIDRLDRGGRRSGGRGRVPPPRREGSRDPR